MYEKYTPVRGRFVSLSDTKYRRFTRSCLREKEATRRIASSEPPSQTVMYDQVHSCLLGRLFLVLHPNIGVLPVSIYGKGSSSHTPIRSVLRPDGHPFEASRYPHYIFSKTEQRAAQPNFHRRRSRRLKVAARSLSVARRPCSKQTRAKCARPNSSPRAGISASSARRSK